MARKLTDLRFDRRCKGALKRADFFSGALYGLAVEAPDQSMSYTSMTHKQREHEWSTYSSKIFKICGDMNNQIRELEK